MRCWMNHWITGRVFKSSEPVNWGTSLVSQSHLVTSALLTSYEGQPCLSRRSVCNKSAVLFTLHLGRWWGLAHFPRADVQTGIYQTYFCGFWPRRNRGFVKQRLLSAFWPLPVSAQCYFFSPTRQTSVPLCWWRHHVFYSPLISSSARSKWHSMDFSATGVDVAAYSS